MVVDPITAVSLASNVVQFIDFGSKLISGFHQLYQSGASVQNAELRIITNNLKSLTKNFSTTYPSQAEKLLVELSKKCNEVADEIISLLDSLTVEGPHQKWNSIRKASKSIFKQPKIDELVARISHLRNEMMVTLIMMLHDKHSGIPTLLSELAEGSRQMKFDHASGLLQLKKDILQSINTQKEADTSIDLGKLSADLSDLAEMGGTAVAQQRFLESLRFRSMTVRHSDIKNAHTKTFDWIFDGHPCKSGIHFSDWLRNEGGIYWIAGKAGSGKSTLMKYLCDHTRTRELLKPWAGDKKCLVAGFYFWNAGTEMQKSLEGLLQSLLFEIFRQSPDLIKTVCSSRFEAHRSYGDNTDPWTRTELQETLKRLAIENGGTNFCFFVDGLDEYEGDHVDIVELLKNLPDSSNIKICLSSRPWNAFRRAFDGDATRKLYLEDLTHNDIKCYVRDKLEENDLFKRLKKEDGRCQELIDEIVTKAHGVFLWVFLVVRSLLHGLTNSDTVSDLQRRLRRFPEELDAYFKHILDTVEDVYQEQTAQMFQIAVQATEPLNLMTFSFLDETNPDFAIKAPISPVRYAYTKFKFEEARNRINARCKDLLEVVNYKSEPRADRFYIAKVDFLHRTVRDFLNTKHIQQMMASRLSKDFDANIFLCRAFLAQIKRVPMDEMSLCDSGPIKGLADRLAYHAHEAEVTYETSQLTLLNELETVLEKWRLTFASVGKKYSSSYWYSKGSFLEFAVQYDLYYFVSAKLKDESHPMHDEVMRPLLDCALQKATPNPNMVNLLKRYAGPKVLRALDAARPHELLTPWEGTIGKGKVYDKSNPAKPQNRSVATNGNQSLGQTRRGRPLPGKDVDEYVHELRQKRPNQTNGRCIHCNLPGHGTDKCYYLANKKPRNWRPRPDIWCYKRGNRKSVAGP